MIRVILISTLILFGCNDDTKTVNKILVSGQSNASYCDWSYFESISGIEVVDISKPGFTIVDLINDYNNYQYDVGGMDMIFVHGERDSILETNPVEYIDNIYKYQELLGVKNIYFSTVGYRATYEKDWSFDAIRSAVESEVNPSWVIGYSNAKSFRDRGMLKDYIHFTEAGCKEMMSSIYL